MNMDGIVERVMRNRKGTSMEWEVLRVNERGLLLRGLLYLGMHRVLVDDIERYKKELGIKINLGVEKMAAGNLSLNVRSVTIQRVGIGIDKDQLMIFEDFFMGWHLGMGEGWNFDDIEELMNRVGLK